MLSRSRIFNLLSAFALLVFLTPAAYADNASKGVGPVKTVTLASLNDGMSKEGKALFDSKCSACHKMKDRYVGPALAEVTKRRAPEWIMNMILNPAEMLQQDETAKELLGEFMVPMTFQNVSEAEARKILEYFRFYSEKGEVAAAPKVAEKKSETKKK